MSKLLSIPMQVKRLTDTAIIPRYQTSGSAGADLHADIAQQLVIEPGGRATIPTGIAVAIPLGYMIQICPRSGLSHKNGVTVHNGPGIIDGDYRDGLGVILHNTTHQQFVVNPGDRIAQMVVVPVVQAEFQEVLELDETERSGGFGSTGVSVDVPHTPPITKEMVEATIRTPKLSMGFPSPRPAPGSVGTPAKDGHRVPDLEGLILAGRMLPAGIPCANTWVDAEPAAA